MSLTTIGTALTEELGDGSRSSAQIGEGFGSLEKYMKSVGVEMTGAPLTSGVSFTAEAPVASYVAKPPAPFL